MTVQPAIFTEKILASYPFGDYRTTLQEKFFFKVPVDVLICGTTDTGPLELFLKTPLGSSASPKMSIDYICSTLIAQKSFITEVTLAVGTVEHDQVKAVTVQVQLKYTVCESYVDYVIKLVGITSLLAQCDEPHRPRHQAQYFQDLV